MKMKIRIKTGTGKSLFLEFLDLEESSWIKEKIFDLIDGREGIGVKSSRFSTVLKFEYPKTGKVFYFKEFHHRSLLDKLKAIFGYTRCRRAFEGGKLLLKHGFHTAIPVVHGTEKTFCIISRNFLVTRGSPGERTYQYFQTRFPMPLTADVLAEKRALIRAAGHEIGRLHHEGIFHGDLRVGNIIINGSGSSARFFFVDNERTRYYKIIPERKRLKNLVQLNMVLLPQITRTDRLRFFNAYLDENRLSIPDKKKLIRGIRYLTEKRHYSKLARMDNKGFSYSMDFKDSKEF